MARTIHRRGIGPSGISLALPTDAQVIRVGHDRLIPGLVHMWVLFDPEADTITRTFQYVGTGHPVDDGWAHVASTDKSPSTGLVWHMFETTGS